VTDISICLNDESIDPGTIDVAIGELLAKVFGGKKGDFLAVTVEDYCRIRLEHGDFSVAMFCTLNDGQRNLVCISEINGELVTEAITSVMRRSLPWNEEIAWRDVVKRNEDYFASPFLSKEEAIREIERARNALTREIAGLFFTARPLGEEDSTKEELLQSAKAKAFSILPSDLIANNSDDDSLVDVDSIINNALSSYAANSRGGPGLVFTFPYNTARFLIVGDSVRDPRDNWTSNEMLFSGEQVSYFENGQISAITRWRLGKMEGEQVSYYSNGQVQRISIYSHHLQDGIEKSFYETGTLKSEKLFKRGRPTNNYKLYHKNGRLKEVSVFNNVVDYHCINYYPSSKVDADLMVRSRKYFDKDLNKEISVNYSKSGELLQNEVS
jgi:hypothetical protein